MNQRGCQFPLSRRGRGGRWERGPGGEVFLGGRKGSVSDGPSITEFDGPSITETDGLPITKFDGLLITEADGLAEEGEPRP